MPFHLDPVAKPVEAEPNRRAIGKAQAGMGLQEPRLLGTAMHPQVAELDPGEVGRPAMGPEPERERQKHEDCQGAAEAPAASTEHRIEPVAVGRPSPSIHRLGLGKGAHGLRCGGRYRLCSRG